jgi:hypothetical protein
VKLILATILMASAISATAQPTAPQCTPDQVSQLEFTLGVTMQAKAVAEARVRQLETELAVVKKELEAVKPKPKESK